MGLGVRGISGGLIVDSTKEQCNLGHSGQTHKISTFYSYEEYLDPGSVSSSISRGDTTVARGPQFHTVRSGHQIPVKILAEDTRSIRDIIMF